MMEGLEQLSDEEKPRELREEKARRGLMYRCFKGGCKENEAGLFLVLASDRTRSSGHKLKHRFPLNVGKLLLTLWIMGHWHRSPERL